MFRFRQVFTGLWIRTLKIDILTLFISLIVAAFTCEIVYSYFRNYSAILTYSKGTMTRNSTRVMERVITLQSETEQMLEDTSGLFLNAKRLALDDPQLILFMLNILKFNPHLAGVFLGFETGNFLWVGAINLSTKTHYLSDPSKLLPANVRYFITVIEPIKHPHLQRWTYLDSSLKVIDSEKSIQNTEDIDITTRPWYVGSVETKKTFWTKVYHFISTDDPGITVSKPIYDPKGRLVGVLGADLSFVGLSDFLKQQLIGKSGHAYITNQNGQLLIPEPQDLTKADLPASAIEEAFKHFKKSNNHNFSFVFHRIRYLAFISNTGLIFNQNWFIITLVPFQDFFYDLIHTQVEIILMTLFILCICIAIVIHFSKRISQPIVTLAKEIDKITNLDLSSEERVKSYIVEIKMIDASVATMRTTIRSFIRYVPKEIVKQLLSQGQEISLHVDKRKLTIFFSDIQNFTAIAEKNPINSLMPLLNKYFDGLSKIILQNRGTIDKYIGDSIMAFWGAPLPISNHAVLACKTALECQAFLIEFNKHCCREGKPELITRFGISTGTVVVGNIGTLERMNYTVIGDAVNTAARLEVTDKIYHVNILISEKVYLQIKDKFLVRPLDTVKVRGKKAKIKIYELVALLAPNPIIGATDAQIKLCEAFTQAYEKFVTGDYFAAKQMFTAIHAEFPNDYPTEFYINRLKEYLPQP